MFCEIPTFGRCCFCMPLRRGILTFGYVNILFSAFMVGLYSFLIHHDLGILMLYRGVATELDGWLCLAIYCLDVIFSIALIYGAHKQIVIYLKVYMYYTLSTLVAVVLLQIIASSQREYFWEYFEYLPLVFAGLCIHVYLLFLVRSLLKKIETSGNTYENQLHQIVNGEVKVDTNSVYPSTVVPVENA